MKHDPNIYRADGDTRKGAAVYESQHMSSVPDQPSL
jgi:hypothetical protein